MVKKTRQRATLALAFPVVAALAMSGCAGAGGGGGTTPGSSETEDDGYRDY